MSYINKIQKGSVEYDINDTRLTVTSDDIGKYLKVNDDLSLSFAEVSGGGGSGTQLYLHEVVLADDNGTVGIISLSSEAYTSFQDIQYDYYNIIQMWLYGAQQPVLIFSAGEMLLASTEDGGKVVALNLEEEGVAFSSDTVTAL